MVECYKKLSFTEREELFDILEELDYKLYRLHDFESLNDLKSIDRKEMHLTKHFEILALHIESDLNLVDH